MQHVVRELYRATLFIKDRDLYATLDGGARIRLEILILTRANYTASKKFLSIVYDQVITSQHYEEEIVNGKPLTNHITLELCVDASDLNSKKMSGCLKVEGGAIALASIAQLLWPGFPYMYG